MTIPAEPIDPSASLDNDTLTSALSRSPIFGAEALDVGSSRAVTVTEARAQLAIATAGGDWVAVLDPGLEPMAFDGSGSDRVEFTVPAGNYRVVSDGQIGEVDVADAPALPGLPELLVDDPAGGLVGVPGVPAITVAGGAATTGSLEVEVDAPSTHPLDGLGEVPADGASYCTFTVRKLGPDGQPATGADVVYVRTTGGTLRTGPNGRKVLRDIKLSSGTGSFVLLADEQPRVVTVTVLADGLGSTDVPVEFIAD